MEEQLKFTQLRYGMALAVALWKSKKTIDELSKLSGLSIRKLRGILEGRSQATTLQDIAVIEAALDIVVLTVPMFNHELEVQPNEE